MYLPRLLLTLSSAIALASADKIFYCPFAQDGSNMVQKPFCCEGFQDIRSTGKAKIGIDCTEQSNKHIIDVCPNGFTPKCCYFGGVGQLCTTEASIWED